MNAARKSQECDISWNTHFAGTKLLLTGWMSSADNEDRRWVATSELRDVLLHGGDELRSHVLWQFEQMLQNEDAEKREVWQNRAHEFFDQV